MLNLFLPILFPSWRFFSSIGPSPRIHYAFLKSEMEEPESWQEFRPRPEKISLWQSFKNLFNNPYWNETLYINTCAERLFEGYSEMREQEIMHRLLAAISANELHAEPEMKYLLYRITALVRQEEVIVKTITFVAKPVLLTGVSE